MGVWGVAGWGAFVLINLGTAVSLESSALASVNSALWFRTLTRGSLAHFSTEERAASFLRTPNP